MDRYAYTHNNPVNYTDPTGHFCTKVGPNKICSADDDSLGWWAITKQIWRVDTDHNGEISESEARSYFAKNLVTPGNNIVVSNGFGGPCTTDTCEGQHPAVDFVSGDPENAHPEIYAASDGIIVEIDNNPAGDFGRKIVIEHDVFGYKFYTVYAHLDTVSTSLVVGQKIKAGTTIGTMGKTPFTNGSIHLHFEARTSNNINFNQNGNYVSLPGSAESYWAESYEDLQVNWIDIGIRFGYSPYWPDTWPK